MNRLRITGLALSFLAVILIGCGKLFPKKAPTPRTTSKDFWIDRCTMTYRGKVFPITGSIAEIVGLLGNFDRLDTLGLRDAYFWDDLGLKVWTMRKPPRLITGIDLYFAHEESLYEEVLRKSSRPEDLKDLAELRAGYPQGFFKGEVVLEGAVIGPIIDFDQVHETRMAYMKTQTGPDAGLQSAPWRADVGLRRIRGTHSPTSYGLERFCADGKHLGFSFMLLPGGPPLRMKSLSVGSNHVKDTAVAPGN